MFAVDYRVCRRCQLGWVGQPHTDPRYLLVEADRARPGTAEHIAALPGISVLDLDLPATLAGARQETWAAAHAIAQDR